MVTTRPSRCRHDDVSGSQELRAKRATRWIDDEKSACGTALSGGQAPTRLRTGGIPGPAHLPSGKPALRQACPQGSALALEEAFSPSRVGPPGHVREGRAPRKSGGLAVRRRPRSHRERGAVPSVRGRAFETHASVRRRTDAGGRPHAGPQISTHFRSGARSGNRAAPARAGAVLPSSRCPSSPLWAPGARFARAIRWGTLGGTMPSFRREGKPEKLRQTSNNFSLARRARCGAARPRRLRSGRAASSK